MQYERELTFAKDLALRCGQIMSDAFNSDLKREWKKDGTPLTYADTTINTLVIEEVKKAFPDDGVLGEEESKDVTAERLWVCDPVDGTMPFSHGLQISTFSLALVVDGKPLVGVVYDPFMGRLFSASTGNGAFMNDTKIHVSEARDLKNSLIDTEGIAHSSHPVLKLRDDFIRELNALDAHTTALWSVILPSVLVAAGEFTAVIFNVSKPEDAAAMKIIVEEAGGTVTDLFGYDQRYDRPTKGYIASNGFVHQALVDFIKAHRV